MERKKILIYLYAAIGDTITALPVVRAILQKHKEDDVKVIVTHYNPGIYQLSIIEDLPERPQVEFVKMNALRSFKVLFERISLCLRFRSEQYNTGYVIMLYNTPRRKRFVFRHIIGIKKLFCTEFFRNFDNILHKSLIKQYRKIGFDFADDDRNLKYPFSREHLQNAEKFFVDLALPQGKIPIALGVSAITANNFSWPLERYFELLIKVVPEYNLFPLFFGAPHEKGKIMPLINAVGGRFISEYKATDAMAIMKHCRFYLGNDTGTMHMADSAGIPCITLFANRGYDYAWHPEGDYHINIIHRQHCGECCNTVCPYGIPAKCIDEISVAEVAAAVDKIMTD